MASGFAEQMNIQIRAGGLQKTLVKKLRGLGVDVEGALVNGHPDACSKAIRAVAAAQAALDRPGPRDAEPSYERRAKGRHIEAVPVKPGQPNVYRIVWPVDELKRQKLLTEDDYAAADRFRIAHETLHKSVGVANWNGTSGGSGTRLELTERQQAAGAALTRCYAALGDGTLRAAALNFILEMPAPGNASVLNWSDFAKTQIAITDVVAARWMAYSMLFLACQKLAMAYAAIELENRILRHTQNNKQRIRGSV
jgi:hypothetical protein